MYNITTNGLTLTIAFPDGSTSTTAAEFLARSCRRNAAGVELVDIINKRTNDIVVGGAAAAQITLDGAVFSTASSAVAALNAVIGAAFRGAGGTANQPDMSNYYTKTEVDSADAALQTAIDGEATARTNADTALESKMDVAVGITISQHTLNGKQLQLRLNKKNLKTGATSDAGMELQVVNSGTNGIMTPTMLAALNGAATAAALAAEVDERVDADAALQTAIDGKQSTLVSGTNIKTISGNSLLGSGDINIASVRLSAILNNSANQVIPASFLQPDALGNAPKSIFPVVKCKEPNGTFFPVYDQTIVADNDTIKFIWKIYTNWTGWFDVKTWFRFCVTYDGANLRIIPRNDYGAGEDLEYGNCFFQNWTNDSNPDSNWQDNPSIDAVFEFYLGTIV
jgi:hypothetical protein